MSHSQTFQLQLLDTRDYSAHGTHLSGVVECSYTMLAGSAACMKLKIQQSGYRLLRSFNNPDLTALVLIRKQQKLPSFQVKAPYSIITKYGHKITLSRLNLGIFNYSHYLLPKLPQADQLYVYVHTNSIFFEGIKQILTNQAFIVSVDRQQIYINLNWFKSKQFMKKIGSDVMLQYRRFIAQNQNGKITNYLKINMKAIPQHTQDIKYNHCLFIPKKTKLVIQKAQHYDLNEITKIIKLPQLYQIVYSLTPYKKLKQQIMQHIEYKPQKKMILLKSTSGLGVSSFLHKLAQDNQYNFVRINCNYFVSEKELIEKIKGSDSYNSTIVYIKNIQWLLEVGNDKNDSQEKMKRIIRALEEAFFHLGDHSLTSHVLIVSFKGNSIKLDMTKNAHLVNFQLAKQEKIQTLKAVIEYNIRQKRIQLSDSQQVINLAANNLGWATFSKVLSRLPRKKGGNQKIKTQTVLNEIGKLTSMEKVQNIKNVTWDDVGGLEDAKEEIIQTILLPIKHPQIFDEWIKPRTGLLFYGPPGTGKTMLGKCIANQCKMSFISVKGPELLNMYIGQSEKNVRDVFERAAASKPCIIFMDQLDALIPKRGQSSDSNQVMDRIVSQLLTQMDKAPSNGIFVIGATNRPDLLDPSIMRPGRFDKQIYLGITKQKNARIQILKAQTRHIKLKQGFDFQKVIDSVPSNFTGADFYGLTSRSITKAAQRFIQQYEKGSKKQDDEVVITQQDFIQTAKNMKPSVSLQQLSHYQKLRQQYK